jgi:hypothetical protein
MTLPESFRGEIPRVPPGMMARKNNPLLTSEHSAVAGATRKCQLAIRERTPPQLENGNDVANGDEFLHPRSVPVCRPNAAVTGGAADCFGLVRPVDPDMRLA